MAGMGSSSAGIIKHRACGAFNELLFGTFIAHVWLERLTRAHARKLWEGRLKRGVWAQAKVGDLMGLFSKTHFAVFQVDEIKESSTFGEMWAEMWACTKNFSSTSLSRLPVGILLGIQFLASATNPSTFPR